MELVNHIVSMTIDWSSPYVAVTISIALLLFWVFGGSSEKRNIPDTSVPRTAPLGRNPLDPSLSYPRSSSGQSVQTPLKGILHPKRNRDGAPRVRVIKPGKLTPALPHPSRDPPFDSSPYRDTGSKLKRLPRSLKYRHIADFSLEELRRIGWDGYTSATLDGQWVPYVCGYDSDPDDSYAVVNVAAGIQAKTIGLHGENGFYMYLPGQGVGEIKDGTKRAPPKRGLRRRRPR